MTIPNAQHIGPGSAARQSQPGSGRARGIRWVLAVLGLLLGLAAPGAVPDRRVPEYTAKAYSLLLFSRYVEWPPQKFAGPGAPIIIGVLGSNPFGAVLEETVRGQRSQDRPVEIHLISTVEEAAACHLVFISREEARQQADWLGRLRDLPVLTVAETADSLMQGAVVGFVMEPKAGGAKLRFDASLPAMQRAGLRISTPMLVSARRVERGSKEGG